MPASTRLRRRRSGAGSPSPPLGARPMPVSRQEPPTVPTDRKRRDPSNHDGVTRRSFIQTLGLSAATSAITARTDAMLAQQDVAKAGEDDQPHILGPDPIDIVLHINGMDTRIKLEPATTLMEA